MLCEIDDICMYVCLLTFGYVDTILKWVHVIMVTSVCTPVKIHLTFCFVIGMSILICVLKIKKKKQQLALFSLTNKTIFNYMYLKKKQK